MIITPLAPSRQPQTWEERKWVTPKWLEFFCLDSLLPCQVIKKFVFQVVVWTARNRRLLVGTIFLSILFFVELTQPSSHAQIPQRQGTPKKVSDANRKKPEFILLATLRHVPDTQRFELRLQNISAHPVAVLRWDLLYEVRLFDKDGNKLTDFSALRKRAVADDLANPSELAWVALRPRDSLCFELPVVSAMRDRKIPSNAYRADCVFAQDLLNLLGYPRVPQGFPKKLFQYPKSFAKNGIRPAIVPDTSEILLK